MQWAFLCFSCIQSSAKMNKLFDQYLPPEEDVSWDNNMADLDIMPVSNGIISYFSP